MPDWSSLTLFLIAAFVLLVTPGPAVLYIVARSIDQGRIAGIVATLGMHVGTLAHIGAAAVGISALLVSSALAFNVLKYIGAAYLIYLGVRKFLVREELKQPKAFERKKLGRIFVESILVNVFNPKTALFFFAFLPQFVDASGGTVALQVMLLGAIFVVMGVVSDGLYALLAGTAADWLKGNLGFLRLQRYFAGTILIGLGMTTALAGSGKK